MHRKHLCRVFGAMHAKSLGKVWNDAAAKIRSVAMITPFYDRDGLKLFCGDNCETMLKMEPASVDLVVTSPPYDDLRTYGGHSWDFYGVAWNLKRLLKPGGVIVWNVNDKTEDGNETGTSFRQALTFKDMGLQLVDTMIWSKPPAGANGSSFCYPQSSEFMFVFASGKPKSVNRICDRPNVTAGMLQTKTSGGRSAKYGAKKREADTITPEFGMRTNVWAITQGGDGNDHPAPFPEDLARDHIRSWSNEGDVVLDPFCGSGTTMKMARETGRRGVGIEINQEYCDIQVKRLEQRILFGVDA